MPLEDVETAAAEAGQSIFHASVESIQRRIAAPFFN